MPERIQLAGGCRTTALSLLLAVALAAPSAAAGPTDSQLRESLKGCWDAVPQGKLAERQKDENWYYFHERCFDGKQLGTSSGITCDGYIGFDCWEFSQGYGVSNGRLFVRAGDGSSRSCEVEIDGSMLRLADCIETQVWDSRPALSRVDDQVFERSADE